MAKRSHVLIILLATAFPMPTLDAPRPASAWCSLRHVRSVVGTAKEVHGGVNCFYPIGGFAGPQLRKEKQMRRVSMMVMTMLAALVLGSGVALAATIVGTNGDDTRNGTTNRDVIYGLGGNDTLRGRGGNDEIDGGTGSDPNLSGGTGNDEVSGGSGPDFLYGYEGGDVLYGGNGSDIVSGGDAPTAGQNELYGGPGADGITADIPAASDDVYGGSGNDTVYADDNTIDDIDCGVYASPTDSSGDSDTVYADRISDGDPVSDILHNCEAVF